MGVWSCGPHMDHTHKSSKLWFADEVTRNEDNNKTGIMHAILE